MELQNRLCLCVYVCKPGRWQRVVVGEGAQLGGVNSVDEFKTKFFNWFYFPTGFSSEVKS